MDTASGQFMQSSGDFPDGSSESIYCDDDELVAFAEPADAFGPARSITTGAPGCGIGEDPIRNDSCSRNGIMLLVDGLLSGGDPEIGGNAHPVCNEKSPIINPVSDPGQFGLSCDTDKSDSATCFYSVPAPCRLPVADL